MTKLELIDELEKEGKLEPCLKSGLVSTNILFQREIAQLFQFRVQRGQKKMDVYTHFSENYGVSEKTIRNAVREMKKNC